jgi:phage FluMu protein Com
MHISNDRYFDDRQRHDLALRMIRHEARTCTIRMCTGLSDDRIRRLYKTYANHAHNVPLRRHRGKSPRQVTFFTRNTQAQFEASLLAGVFTSFGLLDAKARSHAGSIAHGSLFCDAYETHLQLLHPATISFEHAWFLLQMLNCRSGLYALRCRHCDGQFLHDSTTVLRRACPACKLKGSESRSNRSKRRRRPRAQTKSLPLTDLPAALTARPTDRLGA